MWIYFYLRNISNSGQQFSVPRKIVMFQTEKNKLFNYFNGRSSINKLQFKKEDKYLIWTKLKFARLKQSQ